MMATVKHYLVLKPEAIRPHVLVAGLLGLVLTGQLLLGTKGYVPTVTDEPVYVEPAVNYIQHGQIASPGMALQLAQSGIPGLTETSSLAVPVATYARIPLLEIFGANLTGRRVADWFFMLAAIAAFLPLARRFPSKAGLCAFIMFAFHPTILWHSPGRPDLLSLAFGLLALRGLFWTLDPPRQSSDLRFLAGMMGCGLLVGLSGMAHQFGGIFWGVVLSLVFLVLVWNPPEKRRFTLGYLFFLGGGLMALLVWLPAILENHRFWWAQIHFFPHLKRRLDVDFWVSLKELSGHTLLLKPFLGLSLLVLLLTRTVSHTERKIVGALTASIILLAVWRCASFEYYNPNYQVHFLAVLCLLFGFAAHRVWRWLEQRFAASQTRLALCLTVLCLAFVGRQANYAGLTDAFFLPKAKRDASVAAMLQRDLKPGDRVLATTTTYLDVPGNRKTLMFETQHLDLLDFDVVATSDPQIPWDEHRDQYIDYFSRRQAEDFAKHFICVDSARATTVSGLKPHILPGLYIFRRSDWGTNRVP
jgi:hypothetical protein